MFFLVLSSLLFATSTQKYIQKALDLELYKQRYWKLLLHVNKNTSEIKNKEFFLSPNGRYSPKEELIATIKALYNETRFDDNSTACLFPARKRWLSKKLHLQNLPSVTCKEYNKVLHRLDPVSATLVFPSAHINSPASMFGHTFLRINSSYHSKLLSYAINYAADADPNKENGIVFAIKGLFGGYYGQYSLLPYYDKLKEYRDTENRDIWEYNLNLSKEETQRMIEHIWEIKDTKSSYLFFNRNCSYAMLWLLEVARPSLYLRDDFTYQVSPLETIFTAKKEHLIQGYGYRASSRTEIEAYKTVLNAQEIAFAKKLYQNTTLTKKLLNNPAFNLDTKRYILELAIELLQYYYKKQEIDKETYLSNFHTLASNRAKLKKTKKVIPKQPPNPLYGHQAARIGIGLGNIDKTTATFLTIRPAYHSLEDSPTGLLRGTQIEFFNFEVSLTKENLQIEQATIISLNSIPQIDEIFTPFSWRLYLGWDKKSLEKKARFNIDVGFGGSIGNKFGYIYLFSDLFGYDNKIANFGISGSGGLVLDNLLKNNNTFLEYTYRFYNNSTTQNIIKCEHNFKIKQNFSLVFKYIYRDIINFEDKKTNEQKYSLNAYYYF